MTVYKHCSIYVLIFNQIWMTYIKSVISSGVAEVQSLVKSHKLTVIFTVCLPRWCQKLSKGPLLSRGNYWVLPPLLLKHSSERLNLFPVWLLPKGISDWEITIVTLLFVCMFALRARRRHSSAHGMHGVCL